MRAQSRKSGEKYFGVYHKIINCEGLIYITAENAEGAEEREKREL